ncbi:FGGY-family carbohydrate kinase [Thiomicrorhabdus heinhorstiae]|uniref:Carbohydrate kinase n=1 Tax=Thiomicrorhabdus heinhorstiae TaxID=2748010 RepID=A0ABS0BU48_9GAMM|nr:FGGY-family carbohydrate kinase [Thiomicrorhabdus heinhorstiae]MBF6056859.1 hypothetical protein [Thiomicrorhabdus heinhorstiae]
MQPSKHNADSRFKSTIKILGIDFGTSGVRGCVVERHISDKIGESILPGQLANPNQDRILLQSHLCYPDDTQSPQVWLQALNNLLHSLKQQCVLSEIDFIICDATSSTVVLTDSDNTPLSETMMYFRQDAVVEAGEIDDRLTELHKQSPAQGASSTLSKVLYLLKRLPDGLNTKTNKLQIRHQIDVVNYALCGSSKTDYNNALKLGYDPQNMLWPPWIEPMIQKLQPNISLPQVVAPGSILGKIDVFWIDTFGFQPQCKICAGTTDSIAGFLASGARENGDAVTSLGTTLAIKQLSSTPVFSSKYGIYSHRLGNQWLIGGASNTGGNSLLAHYSLEELITLLQDLESVCEENNKEHHHKDLNTCFHCTFNLNELYPLATIGERFPIADPQLQPKWPPLPEKSLQQAFELKDEKAIHAHRCFLFGLLYSLSEVERKGYQRLEEMGCEQLQQLFSVGGGCKNPIWMTLRANLIPCELVQAWQQDAAYGVTRLVSF